MLMATEPVKCAVGPGTGWMTLKEAAAYIGISERHMFRQLALGRIEKRQSYPGANVMISKASCDRYLKIESN